MFFLHDVLRCRDDTAMVSQDTVVCRKRVAFRKDKRCLTFDFVVEHLNPSECRQEQSLCSRFDFGMHTLPAGIPRMKEAGRRRPS